MSQLFSGLLKDIVDRSTAERRHQEQLKAISGRVNGSSATGESERNDERTPTGVGRFLKFLLLVVALLVAAFALFPRGSGTDALPPSNPESKTEDYEVIAERQPNEVAAQSEQMSETAQVVEAAKEVDDAPAPISTSSIETMREGAIRRALTSGESASWGSGPDGGTVTVSAPVTVSNGTCRTITYDTTSETWCRTVDGDWTRK